MLPGRLLRAGDIPLALLCVQGGHSPGKPGKVRGFQSGQGKVRETEIYLGL